MMNYLLDKNIVFKNQRPVRRGSRGVIIILILVLLLYSAGPLINRMFGGIASFLVQPIFTKSEAVNGTLFRTINFFKTHKSLVFEVERLKAENNILSLKNAANQAALTELLALQKVTGRNATTLVPIVGRVFDRPPQLAYDTLLVDVGRVDTPDLALGSRVFMEDNILLGEVVQIFSRTTKIKLYSSPDTIIGVTVGPDAITTNAEGVGGGNFIIKLPRGLVIKEGAKVFSTGARPYLLGVVSGIDNDARNPLQTVYVTLPININAITWIEIAR